MSSTRRMRVKLDIPPDAAQLDSWGNAPGGGSVALVVDVMPETLVG
jgi:hypothetical protein